VDGSTLFSKAATGRHAQPEEIVGLINAHRDLHGRR
jgi:hypothetical protein